MEKIRKSFPKIGIKVISFIYICVCMQVYKRAIMHIRRPGDHFWELVLSFCHMGTVVFRLGGRGFIYSTHLTNF